MILITAKQHFEDDLSRAVAMREHAAALADVRLKSDVLRAAWMTAVGAADAFFCDAYADILSRTLRAKEIQPAVELPQRLNDLSVPVIAILDGVGGWRWRMAARGLIERENVLSLEKIKKLLNLFCRNDSTLLSQNTVGDWIQHIEAKQRMFGISRAAYRRATAPEKGLAKKTALKCLDDRMTEIFQRRHDCIHNCDRPKTAIQRISETSVAKAIEDVRFLVERCCGHLQNEFPEYLRVSGFNGVTRNRVSA
jgi:hypothetical protein